MKKSLFLMLCFAVCLVSCREQPVSPVSGWSVVYASPIGSGQYDEMTYYHYYSQVLFKPSVNTYLKEISPDVWYCNGECFFEAAVINDGGDTIAVASSQAEGTDLDARFTPSIMLKAGQWYTLYMHASTTASVGIRTSGLTPDDRQEDFEVVFAYSSTWDHFDRGSVAFELIGLSSRR